MADFDIRTDLSKNRLYIRIEGFFREPDAAPVWPALESALAELRPGFDVITDLSGFKPGLPGAASNLRRAGELVKAKGRRRAVRVAGKLVTGLMQYKRELKGMFDEEMTRYASSIEEAERILDEWS